MTPDDNLDALLDVLRTLAGTGTRTERVARIEGTDGDPGRTR